MNTIFTHSPCDLKGMKSEIAQACAIFIIFKNSVSNYTISTHDITHASFSTFYCNIFLLNMQKERNNDMVVQGDARPKSIFFYDLNDLTFPTSQTDRPTKQRTTEIE